MARSKKASKGRRRSKAEDMTEAKANSAEVRTATQDEMDLPSPDDILFHMKAIKGAKERLTTVNSLVRNARKAAKKVHALLPEIIDELLALERSDDPSEFKRRMEALGAGLKAIGAPYQLTIHDMLLGDAKEQAYERGRKAGQEGKTLVNPYPDGSDLSEAYSEGWRNGTGGNLGLSADETEDAVRNGSGIGHNSAAAEAAAG